MNEYTILPLMNSTFMPGNAAKTIDAFQDTDIRNIAQAEFCYFKGDAKACSRIVEQYLMSPRIELRLSACALSAFSNLTLGNISVAKSRLEEMKNFAKLGNCLETQSLNFNAGGNLTHDSSQYNVTDKHKIIADIDSKVENESSNTAVSGGLVGGYTSRISFKESRAFCIFAGYLGSVLLHLPAEGFPSLQPYIKDLPQGLRLFAIYIMAHAAYLKGDYGRAVGMCQSPLLLCDKVYPISVTYLHCMIAMCEINLKHIKAAQKALLIAWNNSKKDGFIEPFIEHHGLLQGLIESCIKNEDPKVYARLSEAVRSFSVGWMKVHNKAAQNTVTDQLTTMEFSIAMLAARDWSNQEIADHMGISINTIKHYLSDIFLKIGVKKRSELKDYVLK